MSVKTVKVSNVSFGASDRDIQEFFSFSGDIEYLEMHSENERSQIAYVTFKDAQGAETAVLLSGATIVDLSVNITLCPDYELPPEANAPPLAPAPGAAESAFRKAEDVVSGMLAKGFILGKDALNSAKTFDEKHQLTSTASAKVATLDKKIGFTEKISAGTTLVGDKVREVDQKFQVSEKTKSAFAVAEEKVSNAGSAIMKNRYILTGTSWVTDAFNKVAKAAGEVGQKTKEKVVVSEDEQRKRTVEDFAQTHLSESPKAASAPPEAQQRPKSGPEPAQVAKKQRLRLMRRRNERREGILLHPSVILAVKMRILGQTKSSEEPILQIPQKNRTNCREKKKKKKKVLEEKNGALGNHSRNRLFLGAQAHLSPRPQASTPYRQPKASKDPSISSPTYP